tara:strand:+ start:661 stop:1038 length:378 start_codon:yes stop_codon:yes gene_type:complete
MNSVKFLTKKLKKTLSDAKYRSKQKGINFNLTFEHLRDMFYHQDALCFYTGADFNFESKTDSPSLDRIDSNKGYIIGNIVWCRSRINFMKYNDTYDKFLVECRNVLGYHPNWKSKDLVSDEKLKL